MYVCIYVCICVRVRERERERERDRKSALKKEIRVLRAPLFWVIVWIRHLLYIYI